MHATSDMIAFYNSSINQIFEKRQKTREQIGDLPTRVGTYFYKVARFKHRQS